jgi:hypothetical protein
VQTKLQSVAEATIGTIFGFAMGVAVGQWIIYPVFGIHPTIMTNINMTLWFTAVSVARSYVVRRFFNWLHR